MKNRDCAICKKETNGNITCSKECLSVVRARNGTRNNQFKRGWGSYNEGLINKNAHR